MKPETLLRPFLLPLFASCAIAQSEIVLPAYSAGVEQPQRLFATFDSTSFRYQQLWSLDSFAPTQGTIQAIAFRVDGNPSSGLLGFAGTQLDNVTMRLALTPIEPKWMSTTFDDNFCPLCFLPPPTTVFTGTIVLPPRGPLPGGIGPAAWITVPLSTPFSFQTPAPPAANLRYALILDMVGVGAGPGGVPGRVIPGPYELEAADTMSFSGLTRSIGAGPAGALVPVASEILPGSRVTAISCNAGLGVAATLIGLSRLVQPLDLGPAGSPGQSLYFTPIVSVAPTWGRVHDATACLWIATTSLTVPATPAAEGARVYMQMAYLDSAASPAINVTNAVEFTVGFDAPYASRCAFGPMASPVADPIPNFAPVVRFTGTFR